MSEAIQQEYMYTLSVQQVQTSANMDTMLPVTVGMDGKGVQSRIASCGDCLRLLLHLLLRLLRSYSSHSFTSSSSSLFSASPAFFSLLHLLLVLLLLRLRLRLHPASFDRMPPPLRSLSRRGIFPPD